MKIHHFSTQQSSFPFEESSFVDKTDASRQTSSRPCRSPPRISPTACRPVRAVLGNIHRRGDESSRYQSCDSGRKGQSSQTRGSHHSAPSRGCHPRPPDDDDLMDAYSRKSIMTFQVNDLMAFLSSRTEMRPLMVVPSG